MQFLRLVFMLFLTVSITSCSDSPDESPDVSIKGKAIHIQNFTGHLIRRSGEKCGDGATIVVVLSSENDKQEYTYQANSFRDAIIDIKRGENLSATTYEIIDGERVFLARRSEVYDPPSDKGQFVQPMIRICPKDNIIFFEINTN